MKSSEIGLNANFLKLDNQNLIEKSNLVQEKNKFLMQKLRDLEEVIEPDFRRFHDELIFIFQLLSQKIVLIHNLLSKLKQRITV